jgi:chemotaxis protein MotB
MGGALLTLLAVGCANPMNTQLEELQKKNMELAQENDGLRARISQLGAERDAAIARARDIDQRLQEALARLNEGPREPSALGQRAGIYEWATLGADFLFDSGKATLKPAGRAKIQDVVNILKSPQYADKDVWVLGHTDNEPIKASKWKDNLDLSCNRAETVYHELMNMGITPSGMIAGGQGEYFPRATNATREGRAENRRVEIIAVPRRPPTGISEAEAAPAPVRDREPAPTRTAPRESRDTMPPPRDTTPREPVVPPPAND